MPSKRNQRKKNERKTKETDTTSIILQQKHERIKKRKTKAQKRTQRSNNHPLSPYPYPNKI